MIRAFIAIDVPVRPALQRVLSQLRPMGRSVRVVDASRLHITLRFLGDIEESAVALMADELQRRISSVSAFELQLIGIGAFPHSQRPSVVWAGCAPSEPLEELARHVAEGATKLGYPPDRQPFRAHATVARIKQRPPAALSELLKQHAETPLGELRVREIKLYRSDLTPQGPQYSVLARIPLL